MINDLYRNELSLYLNHLCRTFKLERKIAVKSRYRRIYGKPQTPYERVLASPRVTHDVKAAISHQHQDFDPVDLPSQLVPAAIRVSLAVDLPPFFGHPSDRKIWVRHPGGYLFASVTRRDSSQ